MFKNKVPLRLRLLCMQTAIKHNTTDLQRFENPEGLSKLKRLFLIPFFSFLCFYSNAQNIPENFHNPILSGFNPDPSICRVVDDY
jgi:hypothetical protein